MVPFSTVMHAYDVPLLTKMSCLDGFSTVLCEDPNIFSPLPYIRCQHVCPTQLWWYLTRSPIQMIEWSGSANQITDWGSLLWVTNTPGRNGLLEESWYWISTINTSLSSDIKPFNVAVPVQCREEIWNIYTHDWIKYGQHLLIFNVSGKMPMAPSTVLENNPFSWT